MLPSFDPQAVSLADVMPSCLAALGGAHNRLRLRRARHAVVVLVDGLGAQALRARAGHARLLHSGLTRDILSTFPSTTAAGLGTLCTGRPPGVHGLTGYQARDVAGDRVLNLLTGWDEQAVPERWQAAPTVFESAAEHERIRSRVIARNKFRDSGFTRAVLRGAEFVAAEGIAERFARARELARGRDSSLSYLYVSELDTIAHNRGWESDRWTAVLEEVDAGLRGMLTGMGEDVGVLVTADHGILDVPHDEQILYDAVPQLVAGVRHRFGEPRCLQLGLDPSSGRSPDDLASAWRAHEGARAWVLTREEAVEAGAFGPSVDEAVLPRIGDVIVAAKTPVAYYESSSPGRSMIGQHGSWSEAERLVPLARFGAFGA